LFIDVVWEGGVIQEIDRYASYSAVSTSLVVSVC
jgi:hypothetical protein